MKQLQIQAPNRLLFHLFLPKLERITRDLQDRYVRIAGHSNRFCGMIVENHVEQVDVRFIVCNSRRDLFTWVRVDGLRRIEEGCWLVRNGWYVRANRGWNGDFKFVGEEPKPREYERGEDQEPAVFIRSLGRRGNTPIYPRAIMRHIKKRLELAAPLDLCDADDFVVLGA
jgi:hypothetical protein